MKETILRSLMRKSRVCRKIQKPTMRSLMSEIKKLISERDNIMKKLSEKDEMVEKLVKKVSELSYFTMQC